MRARDWGLVVLALLPAVTLVGIFWAIWGNEHHVVNQFVGYRGRWPQVTFLLQSVTNYGNFILFGAYAGLLVAADVRRDASLRRFALCWLVAFLLTLLAIYLVKHHVGRARPYVASGLEAVELLNAYHSFPSGHTTEAVLLVVPLALLIGRRVPAVALGCIAGLIAFTRIFLGVHYLTDVLGGVAFGTLGALLAWWLYRRAERRSREHHSLAEIPAPL
ncbi:MAG: phosphatase PAP2 family protein [Planctomycetaceae bacterium]|nr:phosphatase PAP2 family protein [Planctomycetaceae bacterium]